jgi:hypothetical protein
MVGKPPDCWIGWRAQASDVAEEFDQKNATSPLHRLQADHYAVGLRLQALHALGKINIDEDVAAMMAMCATLCEMRDVRARWLVVSL